MKAKKLLAKENKIKTFSAFWLMWLICSALILSPAFVRLASAEQLEKEVSWYSIYLGQDKIGYIKETGERIKQDGRWYFKTRAESKIFFNRLGKKIEMVVNSEYLETEEGLLKKVLSEQLLSAQPIIIEAEIEKDKVSLKTTVGDRTFSRDLTYSGQLLGPVGIAQLGSNYLKNEGDKVEYQTLLVELSQVVSGERILVGEEDLEYRGEIIKARKIEEKFLGQGDTRQVWTDLEGNEIKSIQSSPFGEMITLLSDEKEALSGLELTMLSQEHFQSSLIKSNVRLPQARGLEKLVVRLKHKNPNIGWPEIQNDYQRVVAMSDDTLIVELNRVKIEAETKSQLSAEEKELYLKANAYLDCNDPEIQKVAKQVNGSETDALKKALQLRDWVFQNMTFDLGIVFAPASEIIRDKRGTCAGYASLLASLLRAADIPSRYLMGLVYVNGVWGGHAWVEAWVKGRWVPLDAAIPSPDVADPARLAIAWSSLEEGPGESLVAAQKVFGYLEIEILEFNLNGQSIKVEEGQPLYEVKGGLYWNPGLQIELKAPKGFSFSDLNKVWPDKTLLTLTGPEGQIIKLLQDGWLPVKDPEKQLINSLKKEVKGGKITYLNLWGKKRPAMVSAGKSAVAIINGLDLFLLTAQGEDSARLLDIALKNFQNRLIIN